MRETIKTPKNDGVNSKRSIAFASIILGAAAIAISGCSVGGGRTFVRGDVPVQPAVQQAFSPIEGNWTHSEGLFKATFKNGRFESVSPQTGDRLAAGSYAVLGQDQISLNFKTARDTQESAVCQIIAGSRLTCAPTNGSSFSMNRSA